MSWVLQVKARMGQLQLAGQNRRILSNCELGSQVQHQAELAGERRFTSVALSCCLLIPGPRHQCCDV